jgi:hypothetical protein
MFDRLTNRMNVKTVALLATLETRLDRILIGWLLLAGTIATARMVFSGIEVPIAGTATVGSYMLLIVAPFVSTLLAMRWFADGHLLPQPSTRLARLGRWRTVGMGEMQAHPLYGAKGIMVSLLVGMMLNVPLRAAEYFAAMPPLPQVAPAWLSALHFAMTLDAALFSSLYMIAFVAALRRVPLFPRLLVAIWIGDLTMQLITAKLVVAAGPIPASVTPLLTVLLEANTQKVLISMALWLPYLLLSQRVNVTYRQRVPA